MWSTSLRVGNSCDDATNTTNPPMAQDPKKLVGTTFDRASRTMFTQVISELVRSLKDDDLSLAQVATVHLLMQAGSMRVLEVAERLGQSPSTSSRMVDALAQRGLVSREEDPEDRRARVLTLTAQGRALAERMNEDRLRVFAQHIPFVPNKLADRVLSSLLKRREASKSRTR